MGVASIKPGAPLASRGIEHTAYMGVISLLKDYKPERSCREHMLTDLPKVLHSPQGTLEKKIALIVGESERIAEDRLQRLPEGTPRLTPDQALAVVSYTYDVGLNSEEEGADNIFVALNDSLRKRDSATMLLLKPYLAYLMDAFKALPVAKGTVYRGVPSEKLAKVQSEYKMCSGIHWSAFTSCSLRLEIAKNFAKDKGGIIFCIQTCTARDVQAYSAFFAVEEEVVLSPNVRLVVRKECTRQSDGYYYVDLVEDIGTNLVF